MLNKAGFWEKRECEKLKSRYKKQEISHKKGITLNALLHD